MPDDGDATESVTKGWLLWQLADSAFPTGGFAHSSGLEAAWQHGELRNAAELKSFIEASLEQFGHASLPFMLAAFDEPERLPELDRLSECFISNHVANRASRLQGQALLASAERIFKLPALQNLRQSTTQRPSYSHLSPIFGVVVRALGVGRVHASQLYFFLHLRGLAASAVRLGIVGPMEAQSLQHRCSPRAGEILDRCQHLGVEEIAQTAPLLEIWQGAQDRLYSRLFQS
ncbi:MAG: ureF [Pedosphaera sp.]|nr:ureF [Pedosphaera sp.]